jgi:hypothetical protein
MKFKLLVGRHSQAEWTGPVEGLNQIMLNKLSIEQLKDLAEKRGINLEDATTKPHLIQAFRDARPIQSYYADVHNNEFPTIESEVDLCTLFNSPGSDKFERITPAAPMTREQIQAQIDDLKQKLQGTPTGQTVQEAAEAGFYTDENKKIQPTTPTNDTFSSMSLDELKKHAASEEIELGKAKTRDEVLRVIRQAYGTATAKV